MIRGFSALLALQLVGEVITSLFNLSTPGPVIGMAFLVASLWVWNRLRPATDEQLLKSDVGRVSSTLLSNLALLFVPAGVGIVQYLDLVAEHGIALGTALLVSTFVTLLATVLAFVCVKMLLTLRRTRK